jgi:hypothetical protein
VSTESAAEAGLRGAAFGVRDFFADADFVAARLVADFFAGCFVAVLVPDVFFPGLVAVFFERAGAIDHSVWTIRCG